MLKTVGFPSTRTGDQTIVDGNLVIGTAGKGIDFSATPGTGTSELLSDYEEGTWTATFWSGSAGSGVSRGSSSYLANYVKVGKIVTLSFYALDLSGSVLSITGLPFTNAVSTSALSWNSTAFGIDAGQAFITFKVAETDVYSRGTITYMTA